jgi:hypothetical protein
MWEDLKATPYPLLHNGLELDDRLALLDFYMTWSIGEFIECKNTLSPTMIVLLRNCKRELAPLLKKLDSGRQSYFEQLLLIAKEVLRGARTKEGCPNTAREAEHELERFFSSSEHPLSSDFQSDGAIQVMNDRVL